MRSMRRMDNPTPQTDLTAAPLPDPTDNDRDLLADYLTRVEAAKALGMSAKSLDRMHDQASAGGAYLWSSS